MGEGRTVESKRADWTLLQADARRLPLKTESVHCICTSSPYWGLRSYGTEPQIWDGREDCQHDWQEHIQPAANGIIHDGGMSGETLSESSATRKPKLSVFCSKCGAWRGELGLEPTPDLFIQHMVQVFWEFRRVLRKDGVCWLNLGDSYASHGAGGMGKHLAWMGDEVVSRQRKLPAPGLKAKDQCLIPHRVAMALQADGWWVRDTIIWHKPNPMPSSVTDRTTTSHEYLFLLTRSARYFFDADAIREPVASTGGASFGKQKHDATGTGQQSRRLVDPSERNNPLGRNKRSVWTISTQSFHGAHFATYPIKLVEPCILAGTSEKGCCPKCGTCWKRVVERVLERTPKADYLADPNDQGSNRQKDGHLKGCAYRTVATSWTPTCKCNAGDPIPCTVADFFNGAATTGIAALKHGRRYIGTDLKAEYLEMSRERIEAFLANPPKAKKVKKQRAPKPEPLLFAGEGRGE
ncbi:MAG TPA: site-specific DNA-methyltransferase [Prosthecobacter sp.]|nr:site-specific DNA-methyltransferase [Prosthecobacter sp.]